MNDYRAEPITVHATPTAPQLEAAIRQLIVALGPFLGLWGFTHAETALGSVLTYVGPISAALAFIFGQIATRIGAKKQATLASLLPDSVATFK